MKSKRNNSVLMVYKQFPSKLLFIDNPISNDYSNEQSLEIFDLTRSASSFSERSDQALLTLVTRCPSLRVLVFNERLSMVTPLFLVRASHPRNRFSLMVRRNGLLQRCDWSKPRGDNSPLSEEDWALYARTGYYKCYDNLCREMSRLTRSKWTAMSDRRFCDIDLNKL